MCIVKPPGVADNSPYKLAGAIFPIGLGKPSPRRQSETHPLLLGNLRFLRPVKARTTAQC
ncbi:protein of unknown function [Serratia sp. Tan611]|nr:protein of unknown function [Serratia sp. Tan611]